MAFGTGEGRIITQEVRFNKIHSLFQGRYAYREALADVVVQHVITEQVRIYNGLVFDVPFFEFILLRKQKFCSLRAKDGALLVY